MGFKCVSNQIINSQNLTLAKLAVSQKGKQPILSVHGSKKIIFHIITVHPSITTDF
jgi:hypothetical protein